MDNKKYIDIINKNRGKDKESKVKKFFFNMAVRIMILSILFLSLAIASKKSDVLHDKIYNYLYKENISFTKVKKFYNKYLGGILPIKNNVDTASVFNETLKYNGEEEFYDGVKLDVGSNYLVPAISEGMVVFIGYKENYGNTIIIEDLDGTYIWYGNINNSSLKLYDYVDKGSFVGEANLELYLVIIKDSKSLSYEEYIS